MTELSLCAILFMVLALCIFVLRARPHCSTNRRFAAFAISTAIWIAGIAGWHDPRFAEFSLRLAFAGAGFIPATFLWLTLSYPPADHPSRRFFARLTLAAATAFAALSFTTSLVAYDATTSSSGLSRHPGPLYPLFALHFIATFGAAASILAFKWRRARGLARAQLQYLGLAILLPGAGATTTNLLVPLITGGSAHSWLGPYFALLLVLIVAHAVIRHRLMDLRLVIHKSLTLGAAIVVAILPVSTLLALFWSRLSPHLDFSELVVMFLGILVVTILVIPIRATAERLLDKYVYRARADYKRTVKDSSEFLTHVLDLNVLLPFLGRAVSQSIRPEGSVIYLLRESGFVRFFAEGSQKETVCGADPPGMIIRALAAGRQPLLQEDIFRRSKDNQTPEVCAVLSRLNWAIVLPLVFEDALIGLMAIGPKLSGDPFYPDDIDLLMILANQAGVAIKNAQLYTQVVLANEYIENIVATIESGVVAVDSRGRITIFNRAAEQLTGQARPEAVAALPSVLSALLTATVADGVARTEPESVLTAGAHTRPVMCATSVLRDPAGAVLGAVAVFSDLTPLKELEAERGRTERLAYFEALASSIAHEIKNPLVGIKTFAQLIPRRYHDERFVEEFSRVATREIGRMERLVQRLSALSRSSERPRQRVDVRTPLGDAVEFLKPAFDEKRIVIAADAGTQPRFVLADRHELEQLFINLLMNAYEATPPDGAVSIDVAGTDDHVTIGVADSGPGIPPELLERVFDPFYTTKQRGSGLGLAICAGIAASHRAKLRAGNRPGGGALFTAEFPVAAAVEAPSRA